MPMPTYWVIPEVDFARRCPCCGNRCQAEVVQRTVTPTDSITRVYAACMKCQWEGFADMTIRQEPSNYTRSTDNPIRATSNYILPRRTTAQREGVIHPWQQNQKFREQCWTSHCGGVPTAGGGMKTS